MVDFFTHFPYSMADQNQFALPFFFFFVLLLPLPFKLFLHFMLHSSLITLIHPYPHVQTQRYVEYGHVGLLVCSSTRLEDVPAAETFLVEDAISVS